MISEAEFRQNLELLQSSLLMHVALPIDPLKRFKFFQSLKIGQLKRFTTQREPVFRGLVKIESRKQLKSKLELKESIGI